MGETPVLITWVAVNNDPYERDAPRGTEAHGQPVPGPTLTLLTDPESSYAGQIDDVVLLHQQPREGATDRVVQSVKELAAELRKLGLKVVEEPWSGDDPTDHVAIFGFLRRKMRELRQRFPGRELVIHVSPGTPSMHTIWVLMAETGMIEAPFVAVKSYRRTERRGRPAVVPVELGIETFYKAYKRATPRQVASEDQTVVWDPARFRTDGMRRVYAEARRFAHVKVPILIRGERGTGKTTLASWIRAASPFKRPEQDAHWPTVACGQYSPETMRSELFGHAKGAFTGAIVERKGLLAAAHGDTLFLDEVGDVSPDLQRLLIKVVEERRYQSLGADKVEASDFRLLTATNLDDVTLRQRLAPDFLDRISLLTLALPPLREIRDELPWLWDAVYAEARRRADVAPAKAAMDATHHERVVAALRLHPLPGNLRDVFRVAYRLLAVLGDVDEQVQAHDAVTIGLEALEAPLGKVRGAAQAHAVAAAFAAGTTIDDLMGDGVVLATDSVVAQLKTFMGQELLRLAATRGVAGEALCDVTTRSLQNWVKHD